MNLLAELSSAGVSASAPAVGAGRTGNAPAPAHNPFADVLGAAAPGHLTDDAAPAAADERPGGEPEGENPDTADVLAALVLPAQAGPLPQGAGSALAGLAGRAASGNPLPPGMPHSGNPLPVQAAPELNPAAQTEPRQATSAWPLLSGAGLTPSAEPGAGMPGAVRPDVAQSPADERNLVQRLPAALEPPGEAGNLLRNLSGLENLPDAAVTVRPGALPPLEGAAAVFDPRAMLEANARQHRSASAQAAALESIDRSAAGPESAEPASRPLVARPVMPTLMARDMSALAERVETLAQRPGGVASVSVSLGDLGNVEISVRMEARQAHVQFVVQDAMAREALESQLPRLRAMLEDSGLKLGDVNTGLPGNSERDANGERSAEHSAAAAAGYDDPELPAGDSPAHAVSAPSSHLLDAFA